MDFMHYSVLLNESIDLLNIKPHGVYIDGTLGRCGHTKEILKKLGPDGILIAFDKDPEAIEYAKREINDPRFHLFHGSFAEINEILEQLNILEVDGVLLDLGISSPQIDTPERGFSFRFDAPLDMRMNNLDGMSAADWINSADETELANVFWRYGEEKFSRKIAKAIVAQRINSPFKTTFELVSLVSNQIPYREKGQNPATRVFQAIRIHINNELSDLEKLLISVPTRLKLEGRIVVISFHSLEDRIVKQQFSNLATVEKLPKWVMMNERESEFKVIAKKIKASSSEILENNRSRSAIMRCLERVGVKNN